MGDNAVSIPYLPGTLIMFSGAFWSTLQQALSTLHSGSLYGPSFLSDALALALHFLPWRLLVLFLLTNILIALWRAFMAWMMGRHAWGSWAWMITMGYLWFRVIHLYPILP